MNLLDHPTPFVQAVKHLLAKNAMPTDLGSYELREMDAGVRRQSLFSARTADEYYLDEILRNVVESVINPKTETRPDRVTADNPQGYVTTGFNLATSKDALREYLQASGYLPNPDEKGTIKDLSSDARLDLVVKTNVQLAQGAGQFVQGNLNQDVVDAFPAWELIRYEEREVPRGEKRGPKGVIEPDPDNSWPARFAAACEDAGDDDAGDVLQRTGRMIALKSSGVWDALGNGAGGYEDTLGNPYPPFAFNSGMWTQDVSRAECIEVGLMDEGDETKPASFDFAGLFKEAA